MIKLSKTSLKELKKILKKILSFYAEKLTDKNINELEIVLLKLTAIVLKHKIILNKKDINFI